MNILFIARVFSFTIPFFKTYFDSSERTETISSSINKDELYNLKVLYRKEIAIKSNNYTEQIENKIISTCKQTQKLESLKSLLLAKMAKLGEREMVKN